MDSLNVCDLKQSEKESLLNIIKQFNEPNYFNGLVKKTIEYLSNPESSMFQTLNIIDILKGKKTANINGFICEVIAHNITDADNNFIEHEFILSIDTTIFHLFKYRYYYIPDEVKFISCKKINNYIPETYVVVD
ncbi:MAG: hypothetical protein ACRCTZ_14595 [Sarcina sp.]